VPTKRVMLEVQVAEVQGHLPSSAEVQDVQVRRFEEVKPRRRGEVRGEGRSGGVGRRGARLQRST